MDLSELKNETPTNNATVGCDPCRALARMQDVRPEFGGHNILVANEQTGRIERMRLSPDGHLGAVED